MRLLVTMCGVTFAALLWSATHVDVAQALPQPPTAHLFTDMLSGESNETGFTLGEILDRRLWTLARHPLAPEALLRVGTDVHRAPRRGIQFELLTPGDVGATVHIRW
jgi:hypothetical protein